MSIACICTVHTVQQYVSVSIVSMHTGITPENTNMVYWEKTSGVTAGRGWGLLIYTSAHPLRHQTD